MATQFYLPLSLSFCLSLLFTHTYTQSHANTLPPTYTRRFSPPTMHTQIHPHTLSPIITTTHISTQAKPHTVIHPAVHTPTQKIQGLPEPSSGLEVEMLTSLAVIYRTVRVFLALSCHVDRLSGQQGRWVFPGRVYMILSLLLSVCLSACLSDPLSLCISLVLSVFATVILSACLSSICLSVPLSACLICPSICLSFY